MLSEEYVVQYRENTVKRIEHLEKEILCQRGRLLAIDTILERDM